MKIEFSKILDIIYLVRSKPNRKGPNKHGFLWKR